MLELLSTSEIGQLEGEKRFSMYCFIIHVIELKLKRIMSLDVNVRMQNSRGIKE